MMADPIINLLSASPSGNICDGISTTFTASVSNMSIGLNGVADYGVTFKYFLAPTATPYVGGTTMGTVTYASLTSGGTVATQAFTLPSPNTYYCYAILDATPPDPFLRPSGTVTKTVSAIPTVSDPTNIIGCNGSSSGAIAFSGTGGATFTWTNDDTSIGLAASGSGDISSFTLTNTGITQVVANLTVTPTKAGCSGTPQSFTITANPTSSISPTTVPGAVFQSAYSQTFVASVASSTFAITSGSLPSGLSLSSAGLLNGTPTESGVFTFDITITTPDNCETTFSYIMNVNQLNNYTHRTDKAECCR